MEIFTQLGGALVSRWTHTLAGVTWIGLLYYFNFVQVPSFAEMEAAHRTGAIDKLVPRALWWFRYGALLTVATGLLILAFQEQFSMDYFKTAGGASIATGILLALVMFINVWGVIWPKQRVVIASARGVIGGAEPDPAAAAAGRKGVCASRTNTLFSIPMLFFMAATSHFAPAFDTSSGSDRLMYWVVVLVLVAVLEGIALSSPAAGKPLAWYIDNHRNTIIGGFAMMLVLYLLWEFIFGGVV